jgi:23S rRNA (adenine2503-C2)-methyltransferase
MCDAGGSYRGKLSAGEIMDQLDFMIRRRFGSGRIGAARLKIQFARMGEPSLNPAVLEVLETLPGRYDVPMLMPSVSTVAPARGERFFSRLTDIKHRLYGRGRLQLQFSIHTTDPALRDRLIPAPKWDFERIAAYAETFFADGDRKITLNSALARGAPLEASALRRHFDPARFLIKLTPLNPTYSARMNRLQGSIRPDAPEESDRVVRQLRREGFEVIVSIGETEENLIGSNCGQYVMRHLKESASIDGGYTYPVDTDESPPPGRQPRAAHVLPSR